jgi:HEPN domain-containing protein
MPPERSQYPKDWLRIAEKDLDRVKRLLDDAVAYDSSLEKYRTVCQKITLYYFVERYPVVTETGITKDDVTSSLEQVENLIIKLRSKILEA